MMSMVPMPKWYGLQGLIIIMMSMAAVSVQGGAEAAAAQRLHRHLLHRVCDVCSCKSLWRLLWRWQGRRQRQ
jgi:hypothetical protein